MGNVETCMPQSSFLARSCGQGCTSQVEGRSEKNGYVPPGETEVRKVPLEVFVSGDKAPIYGTTFDDDGPRDRCSIHFDNQ